jgi:hypothetical protein
MKSLSTPEEMLERWQSYMCGCDLSVGHLCEGCHDTQVVRKLLKEHRDALRTLEQVAGIIKESPVFEAEWQCEPPAADPLLAYGLRYHRECESYDRTVCSGVDKTGAAMPANSEEEYLVCKNSRRIREQLRRELVLDGLSSAVDADIKLHTAIQAAAHLFENEMRNREATQ